MEAIMVIHISIPMSPIGILNCAPSNSLDISKKISHDCKIPNPIPTTTPRNVMKDASIKNCVRIMPDRNPIALSTPMDCLRSTTALTDNTPIAATPTISPRPLNPWKSLLNAFLVALSSSRLSKRLSALKPFSRNMFSSFCE